MGKNFDDLFDDFLGKNKGDKNKDGVDKFNKMKDDVKNIIDSLMNLKNFNEEEKDDFDIKNTEKLDESDFLDSILDNELDEPDEVENFKDGDLYVQKQTWYLPTGKLTKMVFSDDPQNFELSPKSNTNKKRGVINKKPLEVQLQEAIESDNFERAAEIRDIMNPPKKKKSCSRKTK